MIEADPDIQQYGHITKDVLERRIKAHALLDNTIFINASHILKSPITHSVIEENSKLLENKVIVPTKTASHSGFDAMVDNKFEKPEEYGPWWTSNDFDLSQNTLQERNEVLKKSTRKCVEHDISEMRTIFSNPIVDELTDSNSPLYQKVQPYCRPEKVAEALRKTDHSSRKFVAKETEKLPAEARIPIKKYADANYHITGATSRKATATFHPNDLLNFKQSYDKAITVTNNGSFQTTGSNTNLNINNNELILEPEYAKPLDAVALCEYFKISAMIEKSVAELSTEKVLELRNKKETQNLATKLSEIILNLPYDDFTENDINTLYNLKEYESEFNKVLRDSIKKERKSEIEDIQKSIQTKSLPDIAKGTVVKIGTPITFSLMSNSLLDTGTVSSVMSGFAATVIQYWLLNDGLPTLIESDFTEFENVYNDRDI